MSEQFREFDRSQRFERHRHVTAMQTPPTRLKAPKDDKGGKKGIGDGRPGKCRKLVESKAQCQCNRDERMQAEEWTASDKHSYPQRDAKQCRACLLMSKRQKVSLDKAPRGGISSRGRGVVETWRHASQEIEANKLEPLVVKTVHEGFQRLRILIDAQRATVQHRTGRTDAPIVQKQDVTGLHCRSQARSLMERERARAPIIRSTRPTSPRQTQPVR